MGVFISVLICLCGCVCVWVCLCVSEEKEDEERRSLRLSSFCMEKREKKNAKCEINKIIVYTTTVTVYIYKVTIVNV